MALAVMFSATRTPAGVRQAPAEDVGVEESPDLADPRLGVQLVDESFVHVVSNPMEETSPPR